MTGMSRTLRVNATEYLVGMKNTTIFIHADLLTYYQLPITIHAERAGVSQFPYFPQCFISRFFANSKLLD